MIREPTPAAVTEAAELLRRGELVAFPTETVYGLGADASSEAAVRRVFAAKGRPDDHPLIVHLPSADHLERWANTVPMAASRLAAAFWPGPLTLILARADGVLDAVTGGLATVALRVPEHPVAQRLLAAFDGGVAAPSANRFGRVSPTTAAHVAEELGESVAMILDGGPCHVGVESTIVAIDTAEPPRLLRPGGVACEEIETVIGARLAIPRSSDDGPRAPGRLPSHYAPHCRVVPVPADALGDAVAEALRGVDGGAAPVAVLPLDDRTWPAGVVALPWSDDPVEAARWLYAGFREADRLGCRAIYVPLPQPRGLGVALRDRIQRAAAERPATHG